MKATVRRWVAGLKHRLERDYLRNPASRKLFQAQSPGLSAVQQRVVEDLNRDGLAFAGFDELVGDEQAWQPLAGTVGDFVSSPALEEQIAAYRADPKDGWKSYLVRLFPPSSTVPASHPLLRFGLNPVLLDVANSYLGLWSKLIYLDAWYTIPSQRDRSRVASQRWHRDPDDDKLLKVFLYFSDVDSGAGPLEYIKGSNSGGRLHGLYRSRGGHYPPEEELERLAGESDRVLCTGSRRTFVFCDTRGFHRGGFATRSPRILAKWVYVSPAAYSKRCYRVEEVENRPELSAPARYALE